MRFAPLGEAGQQALSRAKVLLVGCGALGTVIANTLVRAGVGHVRIVDRDFVELTNLQRQVLFDEDDLTSALPKVIAAANKLARVNSQVTIEPIVADVGPENLAQLAAGVDCIVDGTDNFEVRFLINDLAVRDNIPWVYGGAIGAEGQTMTILPGETACLRCLIPEPPPPGTVATCDTAGILGATVAVIGAIEANEAIKIVSGNRDAINRGLLVIDLWDNRWRQIDLSQLRAQANCACCTRGEYTWLAGTAARQPAVLCGRNAVQVYPTSPGTLDLADMAKRLAGMGDVSHNRYLLRLALPNHQITVFTDGRAIVNGTADISEARTLVARYVGN
jgi:adenylyltransferase/sulfurtransferase